MNIHFSDQEIKEIIIATVVLSFAFGIALHPGSIFAASLESLVTAVVVSFIAVGIGFIAHEVIGHKFPAQKFDYHAEFKKWNFGLLIALVFSLGGFVFAAPGAVVIRPKANIWGHITSMTRKRMGIVAAGGPVVNLILAMVFYSLSVVFPVQIIGFELFRFATTVNIWLGIFNMLPVPPLDGSKVFAWDKKAWIALFALLVVMFAVL